MTEKLEIVQIEESEEESQVMKLSETYWKDYLRDNEYNKDPNKMCELCIEEQIKKHGQQVIPCTGINRAENKLGKHLFDQIVDTLTPEEKAELDALYDPYVYMDTFLDIGKPKQLEDRWYQKIISACLHGDSLVSMSDGSYKKIKDIKIGDKVVSYNETKRSLPINKVTNVWNQGIKPVYRVTLENGDYLDCTRDHPILSHFKSGKENKLLNCPSYETTYKSLEDGLDVGMDVYTVNKSERWGKFSNTDVAKLLSRISELDLSKRSLKRGSFNTSTRTKIVSIEYIGEHTTYDIEVENRHNFVANNIIVHNCSAQSKVIRVGRRSGKTYMMALMMVHEMLVNDKYRVLVVSPYAVQTGEVIKTFLDLCSRLPDNPVKSSKQTPVWEINFHNGSVLMGFTAATNADSVRGQTANRIVLDECLVEDTKISMADGSIKNIKDIVIGDYVLSDGNKIDKVINSKATGIKDIFKYSFDNGSILKGTNNHPVYDLNGFVPISEASYVKVPMVNKYNKNKDEIIARLLGYNHGDGWLYKDTVGFSGDVLGLELIKEDINYLFPNKWLMTINSRKTSSPKYKIKGTTNSFVAGKELHDLIAYYGYIKSGCKVDNKTTVPEFIINGDTKVKSEYLAGLFGAEGTKPMFPKDKGFLPKTITLSQHKSKECIDDLIDYIDTLVKLLNDVGITAYRNEPKLSVSGTYKCILSVENNLENLIRFFEKVGYRYCNYKENLSHETLQYLYYLDNLRRERENLITKIKEYKKDHTYNEISEHFNITLSEAKEYNLATKGSFIRKGCLKFIDWRSLHVFNEDVYTLKTNTEYQGKQEVFNLTVDNSHTYIANGLLTHNCDDIPEAAIVSVMAIKMSVPDVKVWRSGTPKGERNLNRAEQDPMNKCFHYPSYVIPHYDDKMDASLRHEMGDGIGYVQEVMAIIGVANDQVFQSMFLNRAQNKLKFVTALDVIADRSRYIVTIGVDWNHDKVGTRIIVLAYDKIEPQFYIIDKEIVAIEGKTQHAAQDKIIRLNRKYNCEHIFVDKGFGTTQIANIKQFALAQVGTIPKGHPDLKLLDMLAIDYGSSTEVQDPVTGEIVKHPTKQMAVMNAVEVLEKDLIALHPKDDHDIIKQFKNYVEKSRNKGKITYGYLSAKVGDHDLDAIMIALFGMKKTYSSIFISESTQALIKFVDKNDENREESDFDEVTNMLFGISFGRKSQNNKRTENLSSSRSGGFNRRDRGRF